MVMHSISMNAQTKHRIPAHRFIPERQAGQSASCFNADLSCEAQLLIGFGGCNDVDENVEDVLVTGSEMVLDETIVAAGDSHAQSRDHVDRRQQHVKRKLIRRRRRRSRTVGSYDMESMRLFHKHKFSSFP